MRLLAQFAAAQIGVHIRTMSLRSFAVASKIPSKVQSTKWISMVATTGFTFRGQRRGVPPQSRKLNHRVSSWR